MTSKRVTLLDIAERAGLTKAAVSFALNDAPGVSETTRDRVRLLAAEMGYQPNTAARALKKARAGAVGIVIDRPPGTIGAEPFFMQLIAGVQGVLAQQHISLVFTLAQDEAEELATYRAWWAQSRVDGVLVVDVRVSDRRLRVLNELGMPAVLVGPPSEAAGHVAVAFDDAGCMRDVIAALVDDGHRVIGRVSGMPDLVHTRIRDVAMRRAVRRAGGTALIRRGDYSAASASQATRALLAAAPPPTAIVFDSDVMALAGVRAAAEDGVDIPSELSVVAWDDSMMCELAAPAITAVHRDIQGYGAEVARRMLLLLDGGEIVAPPLMASSLVRRGTTAPAP